MLAIASGRATPARTSAQCAWLRAYIHIPFDSTTACGLLVDPTEVVNGWQAHTLRKRPRLYLSRSMG